MSDFNSYETPSRLAWVERITEGHRADKLKGDIADQHVKNMADKVYCGQQAALRGECGSARSYLELARMELDAAIAALG